MHTNESKETQMGLEKVGLKVIFKLTFTVRVDYTLQEGY